MTTARIFSRDRRTQLRAAWRALHGVQTLLWREERRAFLVLVVLQGLQVLAPLAQLWIAKLVIDRLVAALRLNHPLDASHGILWLIGLELAIAALGVVITEAASYQRQVLAERLTGRVSVRILEHTQDLDLAILESPEYHGYLRRIEEGVFYRPAALLFRLTSLLQGTITLAATAILLTELLPLALPLLVVAAIPYAAVQSTAAVEFFSLSMGQTEDTRRAQYIAGLLSGEAEAKEIRSFGLGSYLLQRYRDILSEHTRGIERVARSRGLRSTAAALLPALVYAALFAYLGVQALNRSVSVGDMTLYIGLVLRSQSALQQLMSDLSGAVENSLFMDDYHAFLAVSPRAQTVPGGVSLPAPMQWGIRLDRVSYSYPGSSRQALSDVSLELRPGETVALVGENGAGKTTIVKLLARLYEPGAGEITVDGRDIRQLDPEAWRHQIAIIYQDFIQYHFTAAENIGLGQVEAMADRARISQAAARSGADGLIGTLSSGFDTMLGRRFDGGTQLSGGEWQRIALARAMMRDAPILILDEPTAALDARAEFEVFRRLREMTRDRTVLLISHRFSTVRLADRIYVLDGGRITEAGSHDELLSHDGRYAELFRLQAAGYR